MFCPVIRGWQVLESRGYYYLAGMVALLWLVTQAVLVAGYGFSDGGDSGRYYGGAAALLEGRPLPGKGASYFGYVLFVTPFVALGLDRVAIGIVQILLNGVALVCLYRLAAAMYGARAAWMACLLFAAFPDVHYWHLIIYSDSLFTSALVIAASLLVVARSNTGRALGIALALFACSVRPNGVAFAGALLVGLLAWLWWGGRQRWFAVAALGLVALIPLAWGLLGIMLSRQEVLQTWVDGEVIWGYAANAVPLLPGQLPENLRELHPLAAITQLALEQPGHFASIVGAKLFYLFAHVRPYFTGFHNALSLIFLAPLYLLALVGLTRAQSRNRAAVILLGATILLQAAIVALTFTDWDGRHLIPIYPFLAVFAGAGGAWLWSRLRHTGSKRS